MYCFLNMIYEFKLSMFFLTMKLLLKWHVFSQCFIIFARYICFNLLCFTTGIRLVLAILFQSTTDHDVTNLLGRDLLLHSTMPTKERRKREAYIPPLTYMSIRTWKHDRTSASCPIALVHVQCRSLPRSHFIFYNTRFH